MSDENAPDTGLAPEETKTEAPVSPFGADGVLVKDWQKQAPEGYEGLRDDKSLSTVKDIWGLSKNFINTKKMVGAETMVRPNDKWGDDDWVEFHVAGGRPETAGDYNIKRLEGVPEEAMTDDMINGFQELFHKIGLSKKQSDAIVTYNDALTLDQMKKMTQANEDASNSIHDGLRKHWGLAYDQNIHRGEQVIDKDKDIEDDPAYYARLVDKIKADPDLIRHESNIGSLFVEHKIWQDPGIPAPKDLQIQIADLMKSDDFNSSDANVRKRATDKIMRLREQLTKGAVV